MGRRLLADVSEDAYEGWTSFASEQGLTVASLIEAVGRRLYDDRWVKLALKTPLAQGLLRDARRIAAERRKR